MTAISIGGKRNWAGFMLRRPIIMGILNITPDSFSDGNHYSTSEAAIAKGHAMLRAGADIIDIGGERTRPGAELVDPSAEAARILPVVQALAATGAVISVDTRNASTMAAALEAGARIINDVSALQHDPDAASVVARHACPVILMHMRGTPATMRHHAHYDDLVSEVASELAARRDTAVAAGIAPEEIALDPGFGFAKTSEQNILLLRALAQFQELGHAIAVGVSRKRFIGLLTGEADPGQRDPGSVAAAIFAASHGAAILRVHDVPATVQAVRAWHLLAAP
jgi:dihydropteroate synthase